MWSLFSDYRHLRRLKQAKRASNEKHDLGADDTASIKSGVHVTSMSATDMVDDHAVREAAEEADLKRLGLFLMNEAADLLERVKKYVQRCLSV